MTCHFTIRLGVLQAGLVTTCNSSKKIDHSAVSGIDARRRSRRSQALTNRRALRYIEPIRMAKAAHGSARSVSRRQFIRHAAAGAGAVASSASLVEADQAGRQPQGPIRSTNAPPGRSSSTAPTPASTPPGIKIPDELATASRTPATDLQFPMTGAQVFANACKQEGVAALFCCPGNYGVIHAIAATGIPTYSGRHEGAMTHAADAFIRITGELAMASGTEGPGFTDMICGIACANAARTPLLIVASNMAIGQEDTEAGIQLAYQQPTTCTSTRGMPFVSCGA